MGRFVVDASCGAKWFLPEVHDEAAKRLLTGKHDLRVPDFFFVEIGNILWKYVRGGSMNEVAAEAMMASLAAMSLHVVPSWSLVALALPIACQTGRTVYDCLYLALAIREQIELVTADERFYNALKDGPLAHSIRWIEDVPQTAAI